MALVSNGRKTRPLTVRPGARAPLAHRRPGYSLSGCTPAEPDSASPGNRYFTWQYERALGANLRDSVQEVQRQDRERDSGCIPGSAMAHCDAAGVNGSNRILFHGAPLRGWCRMDVWEVPSSSCSLVLTEASSWMADRSAQSDFQGEVAGARIGWAEDVCW